MEFNLYDFLKEQSTKLGNEIDGTTSAMYNNMVKVVFPVNRTTVNYNQEKYYSWRIFGAPYMLLDDPPELGEGHSKIMGEWYYSQLQQSQILTLKLGIPKYTGNQSIAHTVDWLNAVAQSSADNEFTLSGFALGVAGMNITGLNDASRQYIFYNRYELYIQHVRLMIISMAAYLGISDYPVPALTSGEYATKSIKETDWFTYTTNGMNVQSIRNMFTTMGLDIWDAMKGQGSQERQGRKFYDVAGGPPAIVQFVVTPTNGTDAFHNDATQSKAASKAQEGAAIGQEVAWLTNSTSGYSITEAISDVTQSVAESSAQVIEAMNADPAVSMFGSSIIGMIRGLTGERMIFPDIYSGSSFTQGNSYTIKLASPQGDPYSYFINIGLPLCYIIPAVGPAAASRNAYKTPFMCQAYVTGQTAMPLAIIGDVSIQRGTAGAMNKDGLPLEVEVSITLRNLYSVLAVSSINDPAQFLSNESLMEYIASYTNIDTWNKSILNQYLSRDIAPEVAKEGMSVDKITERLFDNLGRYGAEQLYMYDLANAAR